MQLEKLFDTHLQKVSWEHWNSPNSVKHEATVSDQLA